ncbi:MAG: D-aminoacyl-tRNA deacylase [Oligoflexia bacterium]|nr:D-aminoacyl-tRNA deacylase [Oligoflexia bacterium]
MRAVIQRVNQAEVHVSGQLVSSIGPGIVTLLGVARGDTEASAQKLIRKILELRIFEDEHGKMNRSLLDINGQHLIISQFTLCAETSSGRRPSFMNAESPELAKKLWEYSIKTSQLAKVMTVGGIFQADMQVNLINNGPVTFVLES